MLRATVIAALLLSGCSGQPSSSVSIETARQRLLALSDERSVFLCEANIRKMAELVDEMDFRAGMLETRKKEAIARARTTDEIAFANRMHGYDLKQALASLQDPMDEAERAIASDCPSSSRQMRTEAQNVGRYRSLSNALIACADGLDQVVAELAKRVPSSWKSYSGAAVQCWGRISEGAKMEGVLSTPVEPSAGHAPTPVASSSASPTSAPPPPVISTRNESAEEPDTAPADLVVADANLNETWSRIRPRFSDGEWAKLRTLQRQWIRDRDARCGTSRQCLIDWTVARAGWLDRYRAD